MSTQDFAGRVALVTGGASGIGRAVVQGFHDRGAQVVIADLDETKGPAFAADLGDRALYVRLNVADEAGWMAATTAAAERFGGLDFVLNAAGISHTASVAALEMDDWQTIVGVNQTGTFLGCKHGIQAIAATGRGGAIVNVSSVQGVHAHAASFAYNTTKAAVRMMSKSAALSGALFDPPIRCNTVIPGYVSTPMLEPVSLLFGGRAAMEEAMTRDVPLGRMCSAEDIAEAVLFFMSDKAAMITGAELVVDGGLILPMNMSYLKS